MHLGYRKGLRKASWVARLRGDDGRYHKKVLGLADDAQDADGAHILSFSQAQEAARSWFSRQRRAALGLAPTRSGKYTVSDVLDEYLDWCQAHRKSARMLQTTINGHIRPALGHLSVEKLTHMHIRKLHEDVAVAPARLRTRKGEPQKFKPAPKTQEEIRARRSTANRILSTLKAALNRAYAEGKIANDDAWRRVRPFREVDAARVRYLGEEECRRFLDACDPDLRRLAEAALLTGCRYAELANMRVRDFDHDAGTVFVGAGKNSKSRHVVLTDEGRALFARLTRSKEPDDLLFTRNGMARWGKSDQFRPMRETCAKAGIDPPIGFHILRHTHASYLALRGVPLAVIAAQLGHSDTRMAEKHYAHLTPNYIADTIRANFPTLGIGGRPPQSPAVKR
jgi:integrase